MYSQAVREPLDKQDPDHSDLDAFEVIMYVMALAFAFEDIQKVSLTVRHLPDIALDNAFAPVIQAPPIRVMESSQLLEFCVFRHGRSIGRGFQSTHGWNWLVGRAFEESAYPELPVAQFCRPSDLVRQSIFIATCRLIHHIPSG